MTTKRHTCEGWSAGATLAAASGTGSGDQLDAVSVATGGSQTAATAAAVYGAMGGVSAVVGTALATYVAYDINAANGAGTMWGQITVKVPASIPQEVALLRGMDAADTAQRYRVSMTTGGVLLFKRADNVTVATGTTDYRGQSIRMSAAVAGAASALGTLTTWPSTAGSDASPTETLSSAATNWGGPVRRIRGGITAASGTNISISWDDFGASDVGALGPAQVAPSGIAVTIALGGPGLSQTFAILPDGIAVPLSLGAPALAQALAVAPAGIAVAVTLGAPVLSQSMVLQPTGLTATLQLGAPALTQAMTISPAGIAVPLDLGTPTVAQAFGITPSGIAVPLALGDITAAGFVVEPGVLTPGGSASSTLSPAGTTATLVVSGGTTSTLTPTGRP